jgi:LytS/YehU family sensor histidine kinase
MKKYTELLALRFGNALEIKKHFNGSTEQNFLIPPISAFVAMENVIKHNEISEQYPLPVDIDIVDGKLVIRNPLRTKRSIKHSSKIGLKNLDERFKIIVGEGIKSADQNGNFEVTLPLLPVNN